jgi:AcrR family transcriptional regulator
MVIKRQKTAVRRIQIAKVARNILVKQGIEKLTIRTIAKTIGINEGTIYQHFKNKKEIMYLIVDLTTEDLMRGIPAAFVNDEISLDELDSIIRNYIMTTGEKMIMIRAVSQLKSLGDQGIRKKIAEGNERIVVAFRDILSQEVKSGQMKEGIDLEGAAKILYAMIQEPIQYVADHRKSSSHGLEFEKIYAPVWRFFRDAVAKH